MAEISSTHRNLIQFQLLLIPRVIRCLITVKLLKQLYLKCLYILSMLREACKNRDESTFRTDQGLSWDSKITHTAAKRCGLGFFVKKTDYSTLLASMAFVV